MLQALGILLACQLIGEVTVRVLAWPLPGPVLGLVLVLAGLLLQQRRGRISVETVDSTKLGRTANGLLGILGILFVPAGVGAIQHLALFREHGLPLAAALLGSTFITLVVTVWVFIAVSRLLARESGR